MRWVRVLKKHEPTDQCSLLLHYSPVALFGMIVLGRLAHLGISSPCLHRGHSALESLAPNKLDVKRTTLASTSVFDQDKVLKIIVACAIHSHSTIFAASVSRCFARRLSWTD